MTERLREWTPDLLVGLGVLVVGLVEVWSLFLLPGQDRAAYLPVVVGFSIACLLSRREPFAALVLVWVTCTLQLLSGTPVIAIEFAVAIVAFGCARWGRAVTVVLSGLSIPAAAAIGYVVAGQGSPGVFRGLALFREIRDSAYRFSDTLLVGATILGLLILAVPWLAGLVLRATARAAGPRCRPSGPRPTPPGRSTRPSRPARSPASRRSRGGWPATSTTSSATRWR